MTNFAINRFLRLSLVILVLSLNSCVGPGTSSFKYDEPGAGTPIINEKVVQKPFSETWDVLVKELAKSFFVINNIDKASRIINLSFTTTQPKAYVDCGRTVRTFEYNDKSQTFEYEVANFSEYKEAAKWGEYQNLPGIFYVSRQPSLEGRANIYVAPKGESETIITANVRYIWTVKIYGTAEYRSRTDVVLRQEPIPEKISNPISFNTNQVGTVESEKQGSPTKCRSTGLLESQMLSTVP